MNWISQYVSPVFLVGLVAFVVIVSVGSLIFVFLLKKCEKCGKYSARVVSRCDKATVYTAGYYITDYRYFSRKECSNCGHETEWKLRYKTEEVTRSSPQ